MRDIINKEKANFIKTSQTELVNGLLSLQDTAERKEILQECDLLVENDETKKEVEG